MILTLDQLRDLAASVGFPDPTLMAAIAMFESGGNTTIVNDTRNLTDDQIRAKFKIPPGTPVKQEWSIGLWQINAQTGGVDPGMLTNPTYNAQMAYTRSAGGTDLSPWWLTVSRGAYKQYLPPNYVPVVPPPRSSLFPGVTPPARPATTSTVLVAFAGMALTAAAGYAAFEGLKFVRRSTPVPPPSEHRYP